MKRVIHFTRLRYFMIALSLAMIATGIAGYFVRGGFNLGIDFTAGLTEQVQIKPQAERVAIGRLREALAPLGKFDIQSVGNPRNQQFTIKVMAPSEDSTFQNRVESQISDLLTRAFGAGSFEIQSSDFVGPRYSQQLFGQTLSILLVALVLILIYTAFRFHFIYGAAAVICLVHDTLVMTGFIAVFRVEMNTTMIAAILTIIGYSLNDTIVIFDRVRENRMLMRDADLESIINTSITQSLSRTILTSLTTLLAVGAIFVFGSGTIKDFALALIVGIVVGTYSTVFIASPIALGWQRAVDRSRRRRDLQRFGRLAGVAPARAGEASVPEEAQRAELPQPVPAEAAVESRREPRRETTVTRVQPVRKKRRKKKK